MAEQTPAEGNGAAAPQQRQLALQKIYVRDASFEVPNAPAVFRDHFGTSRRRSGFDYDAALAVLAKAEEAKKADASRAGGLLRPATAAAAAGFSFPARAASPSKTPAGFA